MAATLLGGDPISAPGQDLSVVRTLVADADENGRTLSGLLVEFVAAKLDESLFKDYVVQWLVGDFGNTPMLVAEYTVGYASTSGMFHEPDKDPRPMSIELKRMDTTGKIAAKVLVCQTTGPIIRFDYPYVTTTCVWRDYDDGDDDDGCPEEGCDSGGGDGGDGGDDDDDDDNSQCSADQKAIAMEYDSAEWPCDKFVDCVTSGTGTHQHLTGYLTSAYQTGKVLVWSYMNTMFGVFGWIESDWRCPVGNAAVGGVAGSQHMKGTAGDFHAVGFNEDMWEHFAEVAESAGASGISGFKGGRRENRRGEWNYSGYIHIDWR